MADSYQDWQKKLLIVYSPGSGNGKSQLTANLAVALAEKGLKTWVIDADTFSPSQDLIFDASIRGETLTEFLIEPAATRLPIYPVTLSRSHYKGAPLFLTPSSREDNEARFALKESYNEGFSEGEKKYNLFERVPRAVCYGCRGEGFDVVLVDTHAGFEFFNDIWLGITRSVLVLCRVSDPDIANLETFLVDDTVADIERKLVVFSNVQRNAENRPAWSMDNALVLQRCLEQDFKKTLHQLEQKDTSIRIHKEAFLYSDTLANFEQKGDQKTLFLLQYPDDPFSRSVRRLAMDLAQSMFGKK